METKSLLNRLPEPHPAAAERVWRRFQQTRAQPRTTGRPWIPTFALLSAAASAVLVVGSRTETSRTVTLDAGATDQTWSEQVHFTPNGRGVAVGTSRNVRLRWETGTVRTEVEPRSGTTVEVHTDEASVRVVGTVFSVRRDALGTTTWVDRGQVEVGCADGQVTQLRAEDPAITCLPTRPGALLGRADALADRSADPAEVLETVDRGLAAATSPSPLRSELLARRVRFRVLAGQTEGALQDADAYLASGHAPRRVEVLAAAARVSMATDCGAARTYLEPLADEGSAEDRVLLASCVLADDAPRARQLARNALDSGEPIEAGWRDWAVALVGEAP